MSDSMWGLGSQPVNSASSLDKLSSQNGEGFDPIYQHSGQSIDTVPGVEGLGELFSVGQSQMNLGRPQGTNSLFSNHFSTPSSAALNIIEHRSPESATLVSYPVVGSTLDAATSERNGTMLDEYMMDDSESGATGSQGGPPVPSSTADQMMRSYHCRLCKQEFENKSDMQNHSKELHRTEEKSHKCVHCLKSFPTSQQLGQHSLVHSNLRKYPCAYCDKSFKQLSHVQQHQRIHTGERPYKCIVDGCTKAFRQLSSLQQHLKGHNLPLAKSYAHPQSPVSSGNDLTAVCKFKKMALPRPHDLTCQVCEKRCGDDELFFQHIHKHHPDFWRVLSGGLPLSDFVEPSEMTKTKKKKVPTATLR